MEMANSPLGCGADIKIMPDCHAGAGCVIGTTMKINDKICPNLVGVDIGCGVDLVKTNIDFSGRLEELDSAIRNRVPFGTDIHKNEKRWNFERLISWQELEKDDRIRAGRSLGTLGGGNHFIECYEGGWIAVHSGSRNIGFKVAEYYQNLAVSRINDLKHGGIKAELWKYSPEERQRIVDENKIKVSRDLSYLEGRDMEDYLYDVEVMQEFARDNRKAILSAIVGEMGGEIIDKISSVHNYIDTESRILRKGAISAKSGEIIVIPLNMRDGMLICRGKGNPEWNFSAPHGAGRLYSRSEAKELFTVEEYETEMQGIFSTCINASTLDEAPFVYKNYEEIMECIEPTAEILERIIPIFNFKANA